jgi:hypothetical protein
VSGNVPRRPVRSVGSKIDAFLVAALIAVVSFAMGRAEYAEASMVAVVAPPVDTELSGTPGAFARAQAELEAETEEEHTRLKQQFIWERIGTLETKLKELEARCRCQGRCCGSPR